MDLMEIGRRLWESESTFPPPADVAEPAENAQPRALALADDLRKSCGFPQPAANPQFIRNESAACNPHGYGKSATSAESATPATASEWLDWISERCNVVPEDRTHVAKMLCRLHPRLQQRLAERYVESWRAAADDEPKSHRKDNIGRRAANMVVTRLLTGRENIQ